MNRYLVTVFPVLGDDYREKIRDAAEQYGFTALFYDSPEEAAHILPEAEIILSKDSILADHAPGLKWFCTPTAGADQFLNKEVFTRGQAVLTNSSGAYGVTISEHVVMLVLVILRRQMEYNEIVSRKEWIRMLPVRSIRDSRITLVGTGDIGQETAIRLRGFTPQSLTGVNLRGGNPGNLFDRIVKSCDLETVLPQTDILIVSLPGTSDTSGMLNGERLSLLPDGAVVINVGRGTVIEQSALENELRQGRLFAGLDVFEKEPIPADDPFWTCPNLIITPHVAGDTTLPYTVKRIVELFLQDLDNYAHGRALERQVDVEQGY